MPVSALHVNCVLTNNTRSFSLQICVQYCIDVAAVEINSI